MAISRRGAAQTKRRPLRRRPACAKHSRQNVKGQGHQQEVVETDDKRQVLGQTAKDHAGDIGAEGDVRRSGYPGNSTVKITPAKKIGMNVTAHDMTMRVGPARPRNPDSGVRVLTTNAVPRSK